MVMLPLTTTALGIKRASNKRKINQRMMTIVYIKYNKHFLLQEDEFRPRSRDDLKLFDCSGRGHIHTKADCSCAGTKIIPDRISVHISNGDFDAISLTERSCAHASPLIRWSVTCQIDFLPSLSRKVLRIFLKVSPKFFKDLRRVTFKCTTSVKCHLFFYN